MATFFFQNKAWLWPLIFLAILTPFTPFLDLYISNLFYLPTHTFPSNVFYDFLFQYGVLPAQILFCLAAFLLFISSFFKKWRKWHTPSLVLVLTLIIGAGLIVHVTFKDHWGRPRPKQSIEFGGEQPFRPYYKPNFFNTIPSKSFTCGHCTMGFYFFALALVAKRLNYRKLFWISLLIAFGLGFALSLARIAQGGHYFSDVIVSAIIMWITAYTCDKWVDTLPKAYE